MFLLTVSLGANLIFLAFLVLFLVGVTFGYYTLKGSAINSHPHNGRDGVSGAKRLGAFEAFAARDAARRETARLRRDSVRAMVTRLVEGDVPAVAIGELLTPSRFRSVEGEMHEGHRIVAAFRAAYPGFVPRRWFIDAAVRQASSTWVLRKESRRASARTLAVLSAAFPQA